MTRYVTSACVEMPFKLDSISPTATPSGATGLWHRYVISQGANLIDGTRSGSREEVGVRIRELVERLNERREGKARQRGKR